MKITVLNGSPKGEYSVTLQTVRYLEALHPEHTFEVLHIGQRIKAMEKGIAAVRSSLENADLLLFSYPVYTFIAPYQLHRFIELLKDSGISVAGKYATQITTSKHFYDVTAHRYIQDNCGDLGLKYITGLSADMDDLLSQKGQLEARRFWGYVTFCMKNGIYEPFSATKKRYRGVTATVPKAVSCVEKHGEVVVLTDCVEKDKGLSAMIERFRAVSPRRTRVINIREYPFKGGCLGCFNCAVSGECIYKDGFDSFLRKEIQTADAIVTAFRIKDHSMGAIFKLYDDRQFCNGHRTVTMGITVGYLICGDYEAETNLQTVINARAQVGGNFLAGVATDARDPDGEIDSLVASLGFALDNSYAPPQNFYGVGGMKIFRDLIWLMQGMMRADHKFYKAHGQYDFPQKKRGTMLKMYMVGALLSSPKIKTKMGNAMNEGMIMPYKKVIDKIKK